MSKLHEIHISFVLLIKETIFVTHRKFTSAPKLRVFFFKLSAWQLWLKVSGFHFFWGGGIFFKSCYAVQNGYSVKVT